MGVGVIAWSGTIRYINGPNRFDWRYPTLFVASANTIATAALFGVGGVLSNGIGGQLLFYGIGLQVGAFAVSQFIPYFKDRNSTE